MSKTFERRNNSKAYGIGLGGNLKHFNKKKLNYTKLFQAVGLYLSQPFFNQCLTNGIDTSSTIEIATVYFFFNPQKFLSNRKHHHCVEKEVTEL